MSDFGDFADADAFDTAPADGEQVARRLHRYRRDAGFEIQEWDDLEPDERAALIAVVLALLAWGRRQGIFR